MSNDSLKQTAEVILEEPTILQIDVKPTGRVHSLLQKYNWLPRQRRFKIKPINTGTVIKISKIFVRIDTSIYKKVNLNDGNLQIMAMHGEDLARIIAYAIVNRERSPSKWLIKFILNNFSAKEVLAVLAIVLKQMDLENFMKSIISVKGINVLTVSPTDQGS